MTLPKDMQSTLIPPILSADGWKEIPVVECGEKLVPLGPFLDASAPGFSTRIFQDMIYWGERETSPYKRGELAGALLTPFVREGVAKKLATAAASLRDGHALLIWDPYRPLAVQKALYDDYYNQLITKKGLPPDEASKAAQTYISLPSSDPKKPSPHNTGGTADLTIIKFLPEALGKLKELDSLLMKSQNKDERAKIEMQRIQLMCKSSVTLQMGVEFDEAMPNAATRFYEDKLSSAGKLNPQETEYLQNRRLLYHTMASIGMNGYGEEFWHYDCGNQFAAKRTGKASAIYGAAVFSPECQAWENMRLAQYDAAAKAGELKPARHHRKAKRLEVISGA